MKLNALARVAALIVIAAPLAACSTFGAKSAAELRGAADDAFRQQEYERVVLLSSELINRDATDFDSRLQRAIALRRLGRTNEANSDLTRAIELREDAVLPRLYRADIASQSGQLEAAQSDLQALQGMSLRPHEEVAVLTMTGTVHQLAGQTREALRYYEQAIQLGRQSPDPWTEAHHRDALINAAAARYSEGDLQDAAALMEEFTEAKRRAGGSLGHDEHYLLGKIRYLRGEFDAAREHFDHVTPEQRAQAARALDDESFFEGRS